MMAVLGNICINYVSSYMNKYIFNGIEHNSMDTFIKGCSLGAVLIVIAALYPFTRYLHIKVVRSIVFDLKTKMVRHLTIFKMDYFDSFHSADAMQKISNDADSLKTSYFTGVFRIVNYVITGSFSIIMMLLLDYRLACISILIAAITVVILVQFNKKIKHNYKNVNQKLTILTGLLSDILKGIVVIKTYGESHLIIDKYNKENEEVTETYDKIKKLDASMDMCNFLIATISSIGTILVGIIMVWHKMLDYGTVMAIVSLQVTVSNVFRYIGNAFSSFMSSITRYERIEQFLAMQVESGGRDGLMEGAEKKQEQSNRQEQSNKQEQSDSQEESKRQAAITFSSVTFAYDGENNILENVTFSVPEGGRYVLAGDSGCGKSTILKLLLGLYQVKSGSIYVNGTSIREYTIHELRKKIAYVSQDCYLFEGTIFENVSSESPGVSDEEVRQAAKQAGIDAYIENLENGYRTQIKTQGTNLSGGQRQRIALARAFLKKASIFLLDEVTSALDTETEGVLYTSLSQLPKDVTVLLITHRVDTVTDFDKVLSITEVSEHPAFMNG